MRPNDNSRRGSFRGQGGFSRGQEGFSRREGGFSRPRFDQSKFMKRARDSVSQAIASPDLMLVQVVNSIDELNKISNLAFERLSEWYGLHFPEFKHKEPEKYVQIVAFLDRENPDEQRLRELTGQMADIILQKAKTSVGVKFSEEDRQMVRDEAKLLLEMYSMRAKLEAYQNSLAIRLVPNMSEVGGSAIAAKLVAQAGGLSKLATMPSSTIQVLGAEKALFKHLRSGSPPPKHGLIFQHPLISTAPKKARGKLARALAAKLTIAAKADAFSHNSIGVLLREQFEKRAKMILSQKQNPA